LLLPVSRELETTWDDVREDLRGAMPDLSFQLWIEPLRLVWREVNALYVSAPRHVRTFVEERYLEVLRRSASRTSKAQVTIQLVSEEWGPSESDGEATASSGVDHLTEVLNPKYTFGQFVIGSANQLAHAAALAVAEMPGQTYNPLFIHGAPGLGKTHLLHAIGNYVQDFGSGMTVRYATGETFTSGFVNALRLGAIGEFKQRFRGTDVLLVDDVQFLADKVRTEEEFFHTFNALYESGRQLVMTSDRAPVDMAQLETRLQERFAAGLVAELDPPMLDVRLAILRKRAALDSLAPIPEETLREVARHVTTSVRALEGALIRVTAYASIKEVAPSPDVARELLGRLYAVTRATCTLEQIQTATAAVLGVEREALIAKDRRPRIAFARQIAMYLARELTDESLPAIGAGFGGRNHSTVLHAHSKVTRTLLDDESTARAVDELRRRLTHSGS
jgi:chromosomal replication initiator protein